MTPLSTSLGRTDQVRMNFAWPDGWDELIPQLEQQSDDIIISKRAPGAFCGTSLEEILRKRGVTQIVLTGVSTTVGVEATARSAFDYGYNVVFAVDAITDRDMDAHRYSVEKTFIKLGEIDTTKNILNMLNAK